MSQPDLVAANPAEFHPVDEDLLPDDPFTSLNYHFGMLLGVDDFETEQSYHRGKLRLHQGWLHGPGVIWGLDVLLNVEGGEIQVERGLALDGAGRELHLDARACLDPGAWLEQHSGEVTLVDPPDGAVKAFDAYVVASLASCLTRQVPALAEPCAGAQVDTAYSRVWETIDLKLLPAPAPAPVERYPRVRVLLGLRAPQAGDTADAQAADARAKVLAAAADDRAVAALDAFRRMANADAAELAPAHVGDGPRVLTPEDPATTSVVLASVRLVLNSTGEGDAQKLVLAGGVVDYAQRRSHVQTATAQELISAALAVARVPTPGGPQATGVTLDVVPGSGSEERTLLVLSLSSQLDERSVRSEAFGVTALDSGGWAAIDFKDPPEYDAAATSPTVTLHLSSEPKPPWQVIARGTGTQPLVDPAARRLGDGQDFVHIEPSTPS